jgi:hypothetical protein
MEQFCGRGPAAVTPEELRKARRNVAKAAADAPDVETPPELDLPGDQQGQLSRRAEALIARQAEEAKKKLEKK